MSNDMNIFEIGPLVFEILTKLEKKSQKVTLLKKFDFELSIFKDGPKNSTYFLDACIES